MFEAHAHSVNAISFFPDGALLAAGSPDGTVTELPVKGSCGLAISPDGCSLAHATADGQVRVGERC